jgi:hypothetical protein
VAGLIAVASFTGLIVRLGGSPFGVRSGGAALAGVGHEQVELTARLAREAAVAQPTGEPSLSTAYTDVRRQMTYCATGQPAMMVENIRPGAYDAVVGLGAGVLPDPDERASSLAGDDRRIRALGTYLAAAYFGAAPTVGFSGGHTNGPAQPSEAASMARFVQSAAFKAAYARLAKSPIAGYVLEERSTSTAENVVQLAALASQRGWRRVLIVTSHYHLPRASHLVQSQGLGAEVIPAEALIDGALQDRATHDALCGYYAGAAITQTIQREIVALADLRRRA